MAKILPYIVLFIYTINGFAQSDKQLLIRDMQEAKEQLVANSTTKLVVRYDMYRTHESTKIEETTVSETYLSTNRYYQSIEGIHSIADGNLVAVVDEQEKYIILDRKDIDVVPALFGIEPEIAANLADGITMKISGDLHIYTLAYEYTIYEKVVLSYSTRLKRLENVDIYYNQSFGFEDRIQDEEHPRLKVTIVSQSPMDLFPMNFQNNPFFSVNMKSRKVTPKGKYSNYSIINNWKKQ